MNGRTLKKLLNKYDISINQLAEELDCSGRHIYKMLNDEYHKPKWRPFELFFEKMEFKNGK